MIFMDIEPFYLIPFPAFFERLSGHFQISDQTSIDTDALSESAARYLYDTILAECNIFISSQRETKNNAIRLRILPSVAEKRSYKLAIRSNSIDITSPDPVGMFYAVQTLLQLFFQNRDRKKLPCLNIEDAPRFHWRAFMLDEARHFHGVNEVKRILDIMSRLKMNIFHWHLTDDQGWRIEIKQYPRLVTIGSKRAGTSYSQNPQQHNQVPHGGFYTQHEIREIVQYAAERHIIIVPEIEFPGHATSALAAYPENSCTGGPFEVATHWGIFPDIYCPSKESTFIFLQNVLSEITTLFPGEYVHIGGDEAPMKRWQNCPDCLKKASDLGISIPDLQTWFTNRLVQFLHTNHKRAIGWSEVLRPGLDREMILQHWLPRKDNAVKALREGRNVIASPYLDVYLDHTYDLISLRHLYEFNPVYKGINNTAVQNILGMEAPLWSEYVWNPRRLDYQLFPRLLACAETGWSAADHKDYSEFEKRVKGLLPWLDMRQIGYAPPNEWDTPLYHRLAALFKIRQAKTRTAEGSLPLPHKGLSV